MKYFVTVLLTLMLVPLSANAAILDDVTVTAEEATLITVSGNEECANIGDALTVYVVPCEGDDIPEEVDDVEHVDIISINRKAEFEHTFKFNGSIGKYAIGVKAQRGDGDYVVKTLYTKNGIDQFAYDIRDKKFSESELISALAPYVDLLGFSSERLDDSRDSSLLTDVLLSSERLEISNGFEDLITIVDSVKEEWELIDLIEDTKYWFDIAEAIDDNRELLGVDKKWNSFKYKEELCTELLDYTIVNLESLGEDINELMKSLTPSTSGSGSGGGRGNGGGSVSVSVSAGASAVIPPSVDIPIADTKDDVTFVDIEGVKWAETAILFLAEKGVLTGVGNNCFAPDRPVKREELAKILVLAFDISMDGGGDGFDDVSEDSWYADYVYALRESGISEGVSDSEFGVGLNVSRQDMATLLYRLMESKGFSFGASAIEFKDSADVAEYAFLPVHSMAACGVINGVGDNMFSPLSDTTRAEAAKLIYEVVKVLGERKTN